MKKWFGNLKISYKLLVSFMFMTSLVLLIGIVGIINLSVLSAHQQDLLAYLETIATPGHSDGTSSATVPSDATSSATITADKVTNDIRTSTVTIYVMVGIVAASFIASVLMGTYISRHIGNPMKLFAEYAKLLAAGDVDAGRLLAGKNGRRNGKGKNDAIPLSSRKDEFGVLAASFDKVINSTKILAEQTQRIAKGDLTTEVTIRSEVDVLGKALCDMVAQLHELAASIIATSRQVSAGAKVVSDSSATLSQGAAVQASSVQQLSATIEEISRQTLTNAQNARAASELAADIKSDAAAGNRRMQDMLKAMDDINMTSGSIKKVIKVIDDIAFQTNILALNAAVEASRAGHNGKGFAVVAEEVRKLAAKSADAAKETTQLVEGSVKSVERGTVIAGETAKALDMIAAKVAKAAAIIEEIAAASEEQASAIEQVNQGVSQVSKVVQETVAVSEECAAASEELANQAAVLNEKTAFYTVRLSPAETASGSLLSSGRPDKQAALPPALHRQSIALD
jgi:methyl-accepting chemotaxis protein